MSFLFIMASVKAVRPTGAYIFLLSISLESPGLLRNNHGLSPPQGIPRVRITCVWIEHNYLYFSKSLQPLEFWWSTGFEWMLLELSLNQSPPKCHTGGMTPCSFLKMFYLFILRQSRGRDQRPERERIPSRLCTISAEPDMVLDHMNNEIMTRVEIKSRPLNRLNHPGIPFLVPFK